MEEAIALLWNEYQMEIKSSNSEGIKKSTKIASTEIIKIQGEETNYLATTATSFWDFLLKEKMVIENDGKIKVEELTGQTLDRGNGTGTSDVYKIEKQESTYVLKYYENETSSETIWQAEEKNELTSTREDFFTFDEETGTITGIVENTSKDPNGVGYYYEGSNKIEEGGIKIISEENIIIPNEINGVQVKQISEEAFLGCSNLKTLVISEGIEVINKEAFYGCNALTSVTIPSSVTSIGEFAFLSCANLKTVIISEGVENIETGAFERCSALTNVTIPSSVKLMGMYAFQECSSLQTLVITEGVKELGIAAFEGCSALTNVTIPSSVEDISNSAFSKCSKLQTVVISDGVKSIQAYAFSECSALTSITIPSSVTYIDNLYTFSECDALTSIILEAGSTLEVPSSKWGATNATVEKK